MRRFGVRVPNGAPNGKQVRRARFSFAAHRDGGTRTRTGRSVKQNSPVNCSAATGPSEPRRLAQDGSEAAKSLMARQMENRSEGPVSDCRQRPSFQMESGSFLVSIIFCPYGQYHRIPYDICNLKHLKFVASSLRRANTEESLVLSDPSGVSFLYLHTMFANFFMFMHV